LRTIKPHTHVCRVRIKTYTLVIENLETWVWYTLEMILFIWKLWKLRRVQSKFSYFLLEIHSARDSWKVAKSWPRHKNWEKTRLKKSNTTFVKSQVHITHRCSNSACLQKCLKLVSHCYASGSLFIQLVKLGLKSLKSPKKVVFF